jgi:Xaa-Pro dipeptidase
MHFTSSEYDGRLHQLREGMASEDLEILILISPENVYYFSGYYSIEPPSTLAALVVPLEGGPILVVRRVDRALARLTSWVEDLQLHSDRDGPDMILAAIRAAGWEARQTGIEEQSPNCGVRLHRALTEGLPHLVDGSGLAESCRLIKSPAEIACLEAAARMTDAGMSAVLERLRDGVTDSELAAAAYSAMVEAGSEFMPMDPIVAGGRLAGVTHANFSRLTLARGDAVFCHLAAVQHRYCAPGQRLLTIGEPREEWRRLSEQAYRVQDARLAEMTPGVCAGSIEDKAREGLEAEGLTRFGGSGGSSIGVGFYSYAEPWVGVLNDSLAAPLAPNMCFHPTVGLRPRGGPVICAADLVVIGETGPRILGSLPRGILWNP